MREKLDQLALLAYTDSRMQQDMPTPVDQLVPMLVLELAQMLLVRDTHQLLMDLRALLELQDKELQLYMVLAQLALEQELVLLARVLVLYMVLDLLLEILKSMDLLESVVVLVQVID